MIRVRRCIAIASLFALTAAARGAQPNTPPEPPSAVQIIPRDPLPGRDLVAVVTTGSDPDGDPVSCVLAWYVNRWYVGDTRVLSQRHFRAGDTIRLDARTTDGLAFSEPRTAWAVIGNKLTTRDGATIRAIDIPTTAALEKGFTIGGTLTNTGTTAWRPDWGYRMKTGAKTPPEIVFQRVVRPGETTDFRTSCPGFSSLGAYAFTFQMEKKGARAFGNVVTRSVRVVEMRGAEAEGRWMPRSLDQGQTCWVWAELKNTGDRHWTAEQGDFLAHVQGSAFEVDKIRPSSPIAPGATWRARFPITAPQSGDTTAVLRLQMGRDDAGRYGDVVSAAIKIEPRRSDFYWHFNFEDTVSTGLVFEGSAMVDPAIGALVLVPAGKNGAAAKAYIGKRLPLGDWDWDVEFDFRASGPDGFAFARLDSFSYPASGGARLNLKDSKGWAVEFDTFPNRQGAARGTWDPPDTPHVAVVQDGAEDHLMHSGAVRFADGQWRHCAIRVRSQKLTVTVDGTDVIESLPVPRPGQGDWLGFTAGTGAPGGPFVIDNFVLRISAWLLPQ